jgi:hypothetical protein
LVLSISGLLLLADCSGHKYTGYFIVQVIEEPGLAETDHSSSIIDGPWAKAADCEANLQAMDAALDGEARTAIAKAEQQAQLKSKSVCRFLKDIPESSYPHN